MHCFLVFCLGAMSGQPQMASPAATQAALQAAQQAAQNAYITTMVRH